MEVGSNQENNFEYLSILDFSFKKIYDSNNHIFFSFNDNEKKSIIVKNFIIWKDKYPNFGIIFTNAGFLIDCSQVDFNIILRDDLLKDLYYQFINNGLIGIKDECINYHI